MSSESHVDSLREQFQQLQQQHQKKLLSRKQKLGSAGGSSIHTQKTDVNNGLPMEDDLQLELENDFDESLPGSQNADNVTRELRDENGRLRKLLAERDEEMRILRKQVNQERQNMIGSGLAADTAANRIMDLSKKNRELASDIEKEKRKVKQLTKKLGELQTENSAAPPNNFANSSKNQKPSENMSPNEGQENTQNLQDKLKQALAKMAEYRNQCEILKREAKLTQKIIAKECGDGINITEILNEPSGWRGRQQQITSLQNKVNDLRQQLNDAAKVQLSGSTPSSTLINAQHVTTPLFYDEKHKHMLRKMEKDKKEAYEKVSSELQTLSEEHGKLQTKFDAAKTRNKILTNDLKGLKTQAKMLVDKGAHDDELIAALMREQERLQKTLEKKSSQLAAERSSSRQEKVQQDGELVQQLTLLCKAREEKVARLEDELKTLVLSKCEKESARASSHSSIAATAELVDKAVMTEQNCVELSNNSVPTAIVEQRTSRQGDTRDSPPPNFANTDSSPRRRRLVRSSRTNSLPPTPPRSGALSGEGRNRKFEEYQPLYEAMKVERDRLVELVDVLQEREKEARQSTSKVSCDIKNLQRQNVELEKQLARISSGQNSKSHPERGRKQQNMQRQRGFGHDEPTNDAHVEELTTELAIQKDENDALKEALDATLQGKKDDFLFYQDIVEQTKKIFLQGLHQYRKTSAPT